MAGEWTFRVRVSDVSLRSVSANAHRPSGAAPYYRCDFDGKVMQSELCNAPGDPKWSHKATFDYRLDEDTLQDAVQSLSTRFATIQVCYTDRAHHSVLGEASIDLYTLATGASSLVLNLTEGGRGGEVTGILHATLMMEHLTVIETSVEALSLNNLPEPLQVQLSYKLLEDTSGTPAESRISDASRDPQFSRCPPTLTRTSLRVYVNSTLRVTCHDAARNNIVMGAIDVPMKELLTSAGDQSAVFKRNLYADATYRRSFTAHVTATVAMRNLPKFSQLATGANDNGAVHGKPLVEGAMLPPRYSKWPSRLPDYKPNSAGPTTTPNPHTSYSDPAQSLPPSGLPISEAKLSPGGYNNRPSSFVHDATARVPSPAHGYNAYDSPGRSPTRAAMSLHDASMPPMSRQSLAESLAAGSGAAAVQSRRGDGARSPIASAAQMLKAQHDDALRAIEDQQRRVATLTEELRNRTATEQEAERRRHEAIAAEERTLQSRFEAATRNIEELRRLQDETDAAAANEERTISAERADLENELEELARTERDLEAFLRSVEVHREEHERRREAARIQAFEARQLLENDSAALADFEQRVAQRSRARARSPLAPSPMHATVSPPRSPFAGAQASVHDTSAGSPSRRHAAASKGELLDAITTGNDVAFQRGLQAHPELLQGDHYWLQRACSAANPNEVIVNEIIRRRPELVHMVDPTSANTPLHAVCGAQRPNSVVASILLQNGANPHTFNVNGHTPMHILVQNPNDTEHAVKRVLVSRGGVGLLNQPAASGETPAHLAAASDRYVDALRFLIDQGANMTAVAVLTHDGRPTTATPRDKARWSGAEACRRLLDGF